MGRPVLSPEERRRRGNLTMVLRSTFHEEVVKDWFLMILAGKNPTIVEDKRFTEQGGYKVIEDPLDRSPPSQERRDAVMKELLNRIYGQPTSVVHMEQEINKFTTHAIVDATELTAALSPAVLGSLAQILRGQLPAAAAPAVLDTTSTETPT